MLPPCLRARRSITARRSSIASSVILLTRGERAVLARSRSAVVTQLAGQLLGLDHERAQTLGEHVQARIDAGERVQARRSAREQRHRAGRLGGVGGERLGPGAGGGAERVEPAQALAGGQQLVVLALLGRGGVDLRQLVLEQVELALARAGELAQGLELARERPHLRECLGAGAQAQRVVGAAEVVEQLQLGGGDRELAVLVLTVEGDERSAPRSRSSPTVAERPFR